jgi:cob(I)alamin adenosyltransferase
MKIYTRTGDLGTTRLLGSQTVSKSDARIESTGTLDELNAALGSAAAASDEPILAQLRAVQNELFVIGSHLATPPGASAARGLPALEPVWVPRLEHEIDAAEGQLTPLAEFVLPGGCELACRLHLARTVCRRAERVLVGLGQEHRVPPLVLAYVNRLSDWLFVMARLANHQAGVADVPWKKARHEVAE